MDFARLLEDAGATEAAATLKTLTADLSSSTPATTVRLLFARLGRTAPHTELSASAALSAYPGLNEPRFAQADILAKIGFLLTIDLRCGSQAPNVITSLYRTGSSREQAGILRALPWLDAPPRFVELATEAARTNDVDVFAALCMGNTFPADFVPDEAFFQIVMKSMFLGLDASVIPGLARRITPELRRMAADFRKEREAAGRVVPSGVVFIESAP